ncbi:unnamed protein product [Miscanthus lutarioriparius]|uniref:Uncharacterized protein n=1 Tax=Miscanthus lutarioriparius TaxID=422564 RepID=A0A811S3J8_9POAL|nr:unnamed protein product [Miscanthus lutarioriparius]
MAPSFPGAPPSPDPTPSAQIQLPLLSRRHGGADLGSGGGGRRAAGGGRRGGGLRGAGVVVVVVVRGCAGGRIWALVLAVAGGSRGGPLGARRLQHRVGKQGAGGSRLRRRIGSLGAPPAGQERSDILHQERRRLPCVSLVFSAPSRLPRTPPPTTSWLASSPMTALSPATEKVMTDDSIPRSQDHRSTSPHSFPHDLLNVWLPSAPVVVKENE